MTERFEYKGAVLFPLLVEEFRVIAQRLRVNHPEAVVRNSDVFAVCTEEFSARGWIIRVECDSDVPDWLDPHIQSRLRRLGYPIWILSKSRPRDPFWFLKHVPKIRGGQIVWRGHGRRRGVGLRSDGVQTVSNHQAR